MTVDDFHGDYQAFIQEKLRCGVRKLSQEEKLLMFALVDRKFNEESNL